MTRKEFNWVFRFSLAMSSLIAIPAVIIGLNTGDHNMIWGLPLFMFLVCIIGIPFIGWWVRLFFEGKE